MDQAFGSLATDTFGLIQTLFLLLLVSGKKTVFGTKKIESDGIEIVLIIVMCIYLLFANVLLLNVLIAAFK